MYVSTKLNEMEERKGKHVGCLEKKFGWHDWEMMPRGVATSPLSGLALVRHEPHLMGPRARTPRDYLAPEKRLRN